jgi:two-component system, OmpR family, phosphate regulon sensor histidine kinase PhoR
VAVERTRRDRLLTFLLLPVIVLAVLVLSGGSFRASFQLDKLREQAVVEASLELANDRAARLDQLIIEQDNVVAGEVFVDSLHEVAERWLDIADRQTPTVRAVLVIDLDSEAREIVAYASRAPGRADDEFRYLLLRRIIRDLRLDDQPREQLRHLHASYDDKTYLLSYWQRAYLGRRYLVLAWHDVARIVHDYLPKLYGEKDKQSRVNVVDAQGRIVFGPPLSGGEFTVGRHFQTTLYKWRLNVALTTAEELASRAERRLVIEIVLAALSALVVIAGGAVIVNAASRERRLANLKSEFVANVSHELKTPLSLIRMFGELLQSGRVGSDKKRKEYVDIIVSESERLGALIENVLDFARAERGEGAYEFGEADLGVVVSRAVDVCRVRAESLNTQLELAIEPGLAVARLDERAIEIAVINLIDNALKYAPQGHWIGVQVRRSTARFLEVVVSDRGEGIPEEDRHSIFERFVRRKGTKNIRGSGIGLSLVQHVAHAHGGKAWVAENAPHGAAFHFTLRS